MTRLHDQPYDAVRHLNRNQVLARSITSGSEIQPLVNLITIWTKEIGDKPNSEVMNLEISDALPTQVNLYESTLRSNLRVAQARRTVAKSIIWFLIISIICLVVALIFLY